MKLRDKKTGKIIEHEIDTYYGKTITLELLNRMCEDYTSQEPLIKNEKIRKAIRAWADYNSLDNDDSLFISKPTYGCGILTLEHGFLTINFYYNDESLCNKNYTIKELCGEEE